MNKTAFIFPGQGAQKCGMGKDFYENSELAKEIFDTATAELGLDMTKLCFEENEQLDQTEYTQAAMVTACLAMTAEIEKRGLTPDVTAGLSLGEYCAISAAGGMQPKDAISLVRKRGILMQNTVPAGEGAMAAILGLDGETVEKMLESAGEELAKEMEKRNFEPLAIPYVTNVTAKYVTDIKETKALLAKQISSPVRWEESVRTMIEDGVDTFVEIGPGKTLAGFMRRIDKGVKVYNIETWEDMEKVIAELV